MIGKDDIWNLVQEPFDEKLPRRTAVLVKEEDFGLSFAYPTNFGAVGWHFDYRTDTTYDENPTISIHFGEYSFPDLTGRGLAHNTSYFNQMEYFPSLVKRDIVFSSIGLEIQEQFSQSPPGGWTWQLDLTGQNHPHWPFKKTLFAVATFADPRTRLTAHGDGVLEFRTGTKKFFLASPFDAFGLYRTVDDYLAKMAKGDIAHRNVQGKYLVLAYPVSFTQRYRETRRIKFGLSFRSAARAVRSLRENHAAHKIRRVWNSWFSSLPALKFACADDQKAYYKCWHVVRLNYYRHPRWGKTVLEALPVYRGFWQWGLPAAEWHASLNPQIGPSFVKRVIGLFLDHQRADGFVTHAVYLDEKVPDSTWSRGNIIQTPHFPWVICRYHRTTGDMKSLRAWYPKLVRYYRYLNQSRDQDFLNLHLWAITTSYDSGLDTTSVFQKVTYGEDGEKEQFCYPAIFAAERCRYEQAMARLASILKTGEERDWRREAERSRRAMEEVLWDKTRQWYGALHEDGTLDTRVGVDGLFPLAYGLVDSEKAGRARANFEKLIGVHGVYTVAPDEPGYVEETYWRGPAWPKSCSLAMAVANRYYPDLRTRIKDSLVRWILKHPSVWECLSPVSGKVGRGDMGLMATPVVSSNVGAGEALGALLTFYGQDMFSF